MVRNRGLHTHPTLLYGLALLGLICLAVVGFLKGTQNDIKAYPLVLFVINYGDGLIRRGIVGEIVSWFLDQRQLQEVKSAANAIHIVLQVALFILLLAWTTRLELRRRDGLLFALFAVFLTSQFVPTTAYFAGYFDIYDFLLLSLAALGLARQRYALAVVPGVIGPFLHEAFMCYWLAIVVVVLWDRVDARRIAVLCVPVLATAAVYFGVASESSAAQIMKSVFVDRDKEWLLAFPLGQTFSGNLEILLGEFRNHTLNFFLAAIFFMLPTAILVVAYGIARGSKHDAAILALAAVAPLSILLVAHDLSRFLANSAFFALLAILFMETVRPAAVRASRFAALACWCAALILIQVPFVNAFFGLAWIAGPDTVNMRSWPLGKLTDVGVRFYTRNIGPQFISKVGDQSPPGNVWYVEENTWRGAWIRRPGTNTFDAVMTMAGLVVTFVATIERSGDEIIVRRDSGSDGSGRMDYWGKLDGSTIRGTFPGGRWTAVIRR